MPIRIIDDSRSQPTEHIRPSLLSEISQRQAALQRLKPAINALSPSLDPGENYEPLNTIRHSVALELELAKAQALMKQPDTRVPAENWDEILTPTQEELTAAFVAKAQELGFSAKEVTKYVEHIEAYYRILQAA